MTVSPTVKPAIASPCKCSNLENEKTQNNYESLKNETDIMNTSCFHVEKLLSVAIELSVNEAMLVIPVFWKPLDDGELGFDVVT